MASSGGKKAKKKWKAMALDEIMDSNTPVRKMNWADEVDQLDDSSDIYVSKSSVVLPTAPRASRPNVIDESKIPPGGPFHAYVSNIPYEMSEDELAAVFKDLKIKNVRLPREDRMGNRARGFGYIEFDDRASLIAALNQGATMVKGRQIHIEVAQSVDGGRDRRGAGMRGGNRDGGPRDNGGPDRTSGNWRSEPRGDEFDDRGGGYERGGPGGSGGGFGGSRREFGPPGGGGGGFRDRERGGGGFEDRFDRGDRGGGFGSGRREERGGGFDRDDRSFGGGRDDRYSRDDRGYGNFGDRSFRDRGFPRDEDRFSRDDRGSSFGRFDDRKEREGRFGPPRRDERPEPPKVGSSGSEQKVRTKLNLQPRSKTDLDQSDTPSTSNTSIFGGAKPVDTSAKDREIEERLAKTNEEVGSRIPPGSKEKSGSSDWTEERKVEPAPPPKENPWSRKANAPPAVNNGRSSPDDEDSEGSQPEGEKAGDDKGVDHGEPKRLETKRSESYQGKGAHKGPEKSRGKEYDRKSNKASDFKKGVRDEELRIPKVEETKGPNFAGENKFSSLISDDC